MTSQIPSAGAAWALVTGGSAGIGLAYAEQLCLQKHNVILVARHAAKLAFEAKRLSETYEVNVRVIVADLALQSGIDQVIEQTKDVFVELLINNAGKEESGAFLEINVADMVNTIALNCTAPLVLSHHFGKLMEVKCQGEIMFISSIVAFQGVPLIANYAATKSYSLVLAESLAAEFKHKNINISIVAPGFTDTNLSPEINFSKTLISPASATKVARKSLQARHKQLLYVPGFINKLLFYSGKYLQPRRLNTFAFGQVFNKILRDKLSRLARDKVEAA